MEIQVGLNVTLSQKLSQCQQLSLHLLAYDCTELERFLQDEFIENPMLEYTPAARRMSSSGGFFATDTLDRVRNQKKEEKPLDKEAFFMEQLGRKTYSKQEYMAMCYLCQMLNDSGLLEIGSEEAAYKLGVPEELVVHCREILLTLEPTGVFAYTLSECLLLQMEKAGEDELVKAIVKDFLPDVAEGKVAHISRSLDCSTADVRKAINRIRQYNPRPLGAVAGELTPYIVPDILCEENGESWEIQLNDKWVEDYSLNDYYIKMIKTVEDPELKAYFKEKLERVRSIMSGIQQRRETLQNIAAAVLKRQDAYFRGVGNLTGMTMQDIADDVGVHVSTVSRAVKGKYLQYKRGTVFIRDLFFNATAFNDEGVTVTDVKERIREVIAGEDKRKPLSDKLVAEVLNKEGINISRRTVAKYREELGIPGTYDRRETL